MKSLEGHNDWVVDIDISKDDTKILSGSCDMSIRIWEVD